MHHGKHYRRLGRASDHRQALLRNMVTSLIRHGHIKTTLPKAKAIQPLADKMVTLAKKNTDHTWVQARSFLYSREETVPKLRDIAQRLQDRTGGYTRIHRHGNRKKDCAPAAVIEYIGGANDLKFNLLLKEEARRRMAQDTAGARMIRKAQEAAYGKRMGVQQEAWISRQERRAQRDLQKVQASQGMNQAEWEEAVTAEMSRLSLRDSMAKEKIVEWRKEARKLREEHVAFRQAE